MLIFCTTCKGRTNHLEKTLSRNLADNADGAPHKFVLLDYNSQDHLIEYLKRDHMPKIESGRLVVYSFRGPGPFRMAHAKNMAHRLGMLEGGKILVNLDADNLIGAGFADYVVRQFDGKEDVFLWSKKREGVATRRGTSGRIAVSARMFMLTGGYDERFTTWSPDDRDFSARLMRLGSTAKEIADPYLFSLPHKDGVRFKEYPHARAPESEEDNFNLIKHAKNTIANFGRTGMGMVYRNFSAQPITLGPIPTRIFGIGMHKTGTNSLSQALRILGYDSTHWESPRWARTIWEEMMTFNRSVTLEKNYAFSDLPFPLLYQSLDIAYPGSKFILTIRDENTWLESVKNHWLAAANAFRNTWNDDCFTHRIHTELYGRKQFDAEIFLARYRRHNVEVLNYFKTRPEDLLVLETEGLDKWKKLCGFLGQPVPAVAFPRANRTISQTL